MKKPVQRRLLHGVEELRWPRQAWIGINSAPAITTILRLRGWVAAD
jgi:hypothetical protein